MHCLWLHYFFNPSHHAKLSCNTGLIIFFLMAQERKHDFHYDTFQSHVNVNLH